MINLKQNRFYFIILSLIICLLDQITKYLISINYKYILNKEFILFTIDFVKNYGAAFSGIRLMNKMIISPHKR